LKILAVPTADPRFDGINDLSDVQVHWLREIENFFDIYKELEANKRTVLEGWKGAGAAKKCLEKCRIEPGQ
jgi:inorganic pyrophosphatase